MKKNILIIALLLVTALALTGCGDETKNDKKNTSKPETNNPTTTVKYTFNELKTDLQKLDSNLEVIQKSAELVGAEEGYGYIMNECTIEVYKFDKTSDAYKTAEDNQELNLEVLNTKYNATVKNGYAYIINDEENNCDSAIKIIKKIQE